MGFFKTLGNILGNVIKSELNKGTQFRQEAGSLRNRDLCQIMNGRIRSMSGWQKAAYMAEAKQRVEMGQIGTHDGKEFYVIEEDY